MKRSKRLRQSLRRHRRRLGDELVSTIEEYSRGNRETTVSICARIQPAEVRDYLVMYALGGHEVFDRFINYRRVHRRRSACSRGCSCRNAAKILFAEYSFHSFPRLRPVPINPRAKTLSFETADALKKLKVVMSAAFDRARIPHRKLLQCGSK